jgi:hypothetical protein
VLRTRHNLSRNRQNGFHISLDFSHFDVVSFFIRYIPASLLVIAKNLLSPKDLENRKVII